MHGETIWGEMNFLLLWSVHISHSRGHEVQPSKSTCKLHTLIRFFQIFKVKTRWMKVVETIYHKGAHGVSSSRKGYGHLVEMLKLSYKLLHQYYQIIETMFPFIKMPKIRAKWRNMHTMKNHRHEWPTGKQHR